MNYLFHTLLALSFFSSTFSASHEDKASFGYFTNWSIYARNYKPENIPADRLSHLLYAFFRPSPDGSIVFTDKWADTDIKYPGDDADSAGNNLYGNFKQLYLLKQKNRKLKVLMSVGGFTMSGDFAKISSTEVGRTRFAKSVVEKINDLGLDGVDIDWEYPNTKTEAQNFVKLLRGIRNALNTYQSEKQEQTPYLLTIAVSCGPDKYNLLPLKDIDAQVDYVMLMAYDFAGSWSSLTDHQAKYFGAAPSGQACISYYTNGMDSSKVILGVPAYGRSFASTRPTIGSPFQGVGEGSWEKGVYDYKAIPLDRVKYDWNALAATTFNSRSLELISFDDNLVVSKKLAQVDKQGLGGAMIWELSGDRTDQRSLVNTVYKWAGTRLESSFNHLNFPKSSYDNIRLLSSPKPKTAKNAAKKVANAAPKKSSKNPPKDAKRGAKKEPKTNPSPFPQEIMSE